MKRTWTAGLAIALAVTACDDSPTENSGDRLTEQEAAAIMATVRTSGDGAYGQLNTQSGELAVNAPPTTVNVEHESNHPCPRGGRVAVSLDVTLSADDQTQSWSIDAEGNLAHNDCAIQEKGVTLTVDGDPNLSFELHAAVENGQPNGAMTSAASGAFNWSASDGRSGRCAIDISDITDFAAKKRTVAGEVCGHEVRQVTTWT